MKDLFEKKLLNALINFAFFSAKSCQTSNFSKK